MLFFRVKHKISLLPLQNNRFLVTKILHDSDEYTTEPKYPKILDLSFKEKQYRKKEAWHEKIQNIKTIEEKLIEINMPRYYGYKCAMLSDNKYPYNCLPFTKFCTRTHFHERNDLPEFYKKNDQQVQKCLERIRSQIEDSILFEFDGYKRSHDIAKRDLDQQESKDIVSSAIISQINRILLNSLSPDNSHLLDVEVDLDPRHEAFWFVGGITPPEVVKKKRTGWQEQFKNDPVDRQFQYLGSPYLAVRHSLPLEPISEILEVNDAVNIPPYLLDPRTVGYSHDYRHGTTIPGYWPGSVHEFGLVSFQRKSYMTIRNPDYGPEDEQEALHAQGIQSSFAWLMGQACYQGFSTFTDLTYPLLAQTIITDGRLWSFYVYQMNTTLLHSDFSTNNKRINECWGTKEAKLFENFDSGKLIGLNEEVLKNLIHFYVNVPQKRDIVMKPYLGEAEQKIADIEDNERREWLEKRYKHLVSNRPRHRLTYEIYNWEKIYQIDNKTRPLAPKRRPFQLGINPYARRLDDHTPEYIPKVLRPGGPKSKPKWEKTYYP